MKQCSPWILPATSRKSMENVQKRFLAGADKHPALRCAVVQLPELYREHLEDFFAHARMMLLDVPEAKWFPNQSFIVREGIYNKIDISKDRIVTPSLGWYIQFYKDDVGAKLLNEISKDAGHLLLDLPERVFQKMNAYLDGLSAPCNAPFWYLCMWSICWAWPTGTILRADRYMHDRTGQYSSVPYEDANGPSAFLSLLEINPFLVSSAIIDLVLNDGLGKVKPKKRGARMQYDPKVDAKLYNDWKASGQKTVLNFANDRNLRVADIKATIHREEVRRSKARQEK